MPSINPGSAKAKSIDKPKDFKGTIKRLLKYINAYHKAIMLIVFLLILGTVLSVTSPKILGRATTELANNIIQKMAYSNVDKVLQEKNIDKAMFGENATIRTLVDKGMLPQEMANKLSETVKDVSITKEPTINYNYIAKILLIVSIIYLISMLFSYIATRTMSYVANKVSYNLRKEVDEKLDRLPLSFFDKHTHGEILSRISNDVDNIGTLLAQSVIQILQSVFTMLGILIFMFTISFSMTSVAILIIPVSLVVIAAIVKASQRYFIGQQVILGELNSHIEETFTGDLIVKAFNKQEKEISRFNVINERLHKSSSKAQFFSGAMMPIITFINHLGYIGICVLGAKLSIEGKVSIGDIQAFLQYTNQFTQPLAQTANMASSIQGTVASAERVFEILDEKEEVETGDNSTAMENVRGSVVFENVNFGYEKDRPLIKDFNVSVNPGQTIAIVGHTGSGKTTIVNLLMRFYDIDSGDILVDGVSIKSMTREAAREMFAMVLQDTWLFGGTIKENLKYAKQDALDSEVKQAAYLAHADHFISTLPNGYDFVINEQADNISSGQKQLLTIARAILADSPILILDEATSNVDTRTEALIQKAMNKLMEGRTSFVIAHRLSTIKNADLILVMEDGVIVERGKHEELLEQNGKYAKLYNSQFYQG